MKKGRSGNGTALIRLGECRRLVVWLFSHFVSSFISSFSNVVCSGVERVSSIVEGFVSSVERVGSDFGRCVSSGFCCV